MRIRCTWHVGVSRVLFINSLDQHVVVSMLRVASNALIVPPFECAWLSLPDYQLTGTFCLQFECKGTWGNMWTVGRTDSGRQKKWHSQQIILLLHQLLLAGCWV